MIGKIKKIKAVRETARLVKPFLEKIVAIEAKLAGKWASSSHKRLLWVQWGLPPQPEHFDHHIDLFFQWRATRNPMWLERGVFSQLALKSGGGGGVLELCCGDGFNARNFYSLRSQKVIACDFDPIAIKTAKSKNAVPNVEFVLADIRSNMPEGTFDNIIWDAAIEHFTPKEIHQIMSIMKSRLTTDGILSGYTMVERLDKPKANKQHEYEFKSKEDLMRFLSPYFKNIKVFETIYPGIRHNLYFWASDAVIPFDNKWNHCITS